MSSKGAEPDALRLRSGEVVDVGPAGDPRTAVATAAFFRLQALREKVSKARAKLDQLHKEEEELGDGIVAQDWRRAVVTGDGRSAARLSQTLRVQRAEVSRLVRAPPPSPLPA